MPEQELNQSSNIPQIPTRKNNLLKTLSILLIFLILIGVGYFFITKFLFTSLSEKQDEVLRNQAIQSQELPTFLYLKQEYDTNTNQQKISIGRYKSNKKATSTIGQLSAHISPFRTFLPTPDHSGFILAVGSGLVHLSAENKSQGEIFNLNKSLNDDGYISIDSPVFSPDGKKIVYFANFNTSERENEQVRIFDLNSKEDKALIEDVRKIKDDLDTYGFGFIHALNPLYWFKDDVGEKIVFAQEPEASPATGVFGRIWIYDFEKKSLYPIKTYDAQGDLLADCTQDSKCKKLYHIEARSDDGKYLLVSFYDESKPKEFEQNLFVLDLSLLSNNKENILNNTAISLPSCGRQLQTIYIWSPDNQKIICNDYESSEWDAVFEKGTVKENYQIQYTDYAIDLNSKSKDILNQDTKTLTLPKEYIDELKQLVSGTGRYAGGGGENLVFGLMTYAKAQNERIIGVMPNNKFLISRPANPDGSRRQLVVSDLKGNEFIVEEIMGDFQFIGWIDSHSSSLLPDFSPVKSEPAKN